MIELRQSTAGTLLIGPFLDQSDGHTTETGLTITQADVRLSKNGGNMAQKNEASSCTHDELGYYSCPYDTTDTNTLGHLKLMVHESGALPVWHDMKVVTQQYWDSKYSTDKLQVHVVELTSSVIDNAAIATGAIGASEIADGAIDAGAIAASALSKTKFAADAFDALLNRGVANVEDTAELDSLAALILSRLHADITGLTLTIYKTDDSTVFDTKVITKDATADPITSIADP